MISSVYFHFKIVRETIKMSKRSANFSAEEVSRVMSLVKKYRHIIECKKSDAVFLVEKTSTWKTLMAEFNSSCVSTPREMVNLKAKYENIKKTAKKKFAVERQNVYATGGGKPEAVDITEVDVMVHDLLKEQVTGLSSAFDSDITITKESQPSISDDAFNCDVAGGGTENDLAAEKIVDDNPMSTTDIKKYDGTPMITRPLIVSRKRKLSYKRDMCSDKWQELAAEKIKLVQARGRREKERHDIEKAMREQEKQQQRDEHELKMKLLKAESDSKMEKLRLEVLALRRASDNLI